MKGFAIKVAPLLLMLKKKEKFKWNEDLSKILIAIVNEILLRKLAFPATGEKLRIHCDAAKYGIGATLETASGKIVKCFSESLTECQSKWSTFEKELYAIRQALRSFEKVVLNNELHVYSDNQAVVKFIKGEDLQEKNLLEFDNGYRTF